jgi:orotate phosphoribosyltransferase
VQHVFVVFYYSIFKDAQKTFDDMGVRLHHLATWWDVLAVAKAGRMFEPNVLREVESFLNDPAGWSKAHGGVDKAPD